MYDGAGNLTDDLQEYEYIYDAWNRLVEVEDQGSATISTFRYNGLGYRITMKYDADSDASIEAEEDYHLIYDTSWRVIMTRRHTDTASSIPAYKDRTIYHNAGLGGYGGSGYTDSVLMRDADMTNAWSGAADGTLEDRQYYSNNWRGDVVAILDDTGRMIEQIRYTPYGVPFALPAGDSDSDGDWDGTDVTNIGGGYDIREDSDLDGDADFDDFTHSNNRAGGGAMSLGWKILSSAYCANREGYASYEHDAAAPATLAHVRYRVYTFTLGRWTQRDPAGYTDGPNLYGYVGARAIVSKDPMGLAARAGGTGGGCSEKGTGECGGQSTDPTKCPPGYVYDPQQDVCKKLPPAPPPSSPVSPATIVTDGDPRLDKCLTDDPWVQLALDRVYQDCPSGHIITVMCAAKGEQGTNYDCVGQLIKLNCDSPNMCANLAHELLHAADNCRNPWACGKNMKTPDGCFDRGCSESRANHITCVRTHRHIYTKVAEQSLTHIRPACVLLGPPTWTIMRTGHRGAWVNLRVVGTCASQVVSAAMQSLQCRNFLVRQTLAADASELCAILWANKVGSRFGSLRCFTGDLSCVCIVLIAIQ